MHGGPAPILMASSYIVLMSTVSSSTELALVVWSTSSVTLCCSSFKYVNCVMERWFPSNTTCSAHSLIMATRPDWSVQNLPQCLTPVCSLITSSLSLMLGDIPKSNLFSALIPSQEGPVVL